jgi:UDP-N-acetylmuramoyl-L-alanyl-D-glutamate--2,6-diaminopimelate ligase
MKLIDIIADVEAVKTKGSMDRSIAKLVFDSRKAGERTCFVAIKGLTTDGHEYIDKAIEQGAEAIVLERWPDQTREGITYIQVSDSAETLGWMAANFYGRPARQMKLVGVTGTNGKTTTVTLLHDLFTSLGYKAGLLSTVENRIGAEVLPAGYTTPDAVSINELLRKMVDADCSYAFMEVSSHAVVQKRIAGLSFAGGVFTNITHDHLDFHKTFQAYIEAKKAFFDGLSTEAFALTNADDRRGAVMLQNTQAKKYAYSLRKMADFRAKILENTLLGLHLLIDNKAFFGRLIGEFNAYNLLAVYAVARLLDQDADEVLTELSRLKAAEGRFDYIVDQERQITGIVDYAHTPDALEKVLMTIQKLREAEAEIITLIGCGGDRDRTKRPKMAGVACAYSDQVILTSDNPRSEEPEAIIADMEKGVPPAAKRKVLVIVNRREAIRTAARLAKPGSIILVAGKGHEKYQEIKGVRYPFDDKEILKAEFFQVDN